jgi:hypothetical protein
VEDNETDLDEKREPLGWDVKRQGLVIDYKFLASVFIAFTWPRLSGLSFISILVKVKSADSVDALCFLRGSRFARQLARMPICESCTLNY